MGCWERESDFFQGGGGLQNLHIYKKINYIKSKIFNDKKRLSARMLFSVITKNLNWEISTKNLVTFKRWDGV